MIEEWNDAVPAEERVHKLFEVEKLCSRHLAKHGKDHVGAYAANYLENQRKNHAYGFAKEIKDDLLPEHMTWEFDRDGNLAVDFGDKLSSSEKKAVQNKLDSKFGARKAKVR